MKMGFNLFTAGISAYLSAFIFCRAAFGYKIVDMPAYKKMNGYSTPFLGSAAVFLGLITGIVLEYGACKSMNNFIACSLFLFALGLVDEIREKKISIWIHFLAESMIAFFVISRGITIGIFPPDVIGSGSNAVLTFIWLVGITNAFKYLGGPNGLTVGLIAIISFFYSLIFHISGQQSLGIISMIISVSCFGFLPHNFIKTKILFGRSGRTSFGFLIAVISVMGNWGVGSPFRLYIPVLMLGIPIFSIVFTFFVKLKEGKVLSLSGWRILSGEEYFFNYIIALGLRPSFTIVLIWLVAVLSCVNAVIIFTSGLISAALAFFQCIIIYTIVCLLVAAGKQFYISKGSTNSIK